MTAAAAAGFEILQDTQLINPDSSTVPSFNVGIDARQRRPPTPAYPNLGCFPVLIRWASNFPEACWKGRLFPPRCFIEPPCPGNLTKKLHTSSEGTTTTSASGVAAQHILLYVLRRSKWTEVLFADRLRPCRQHGASRRQTRQQRRRAMGHGTRAGDYTTRATLCAKHSRVLVCTPPRHGGAPCHRAMGRAVARGRGFGRCPSRKTEAGLEPLGS